jgi:hypothetical protein
MLAKPGWHNLKLRFMPPTIEGVVLRPISVEAAMATDESEDFTEDLFMPRGALQEVRLNHYIQFRPWRSKQSYMLNVGYLLAHFIVDPMRGYEEYLRMVQDCGEAPSNLIEGPSSPQYEQGDC